MFGLILKSNYNQSMSAKVLVVDDAPFIREVIKQVLKTSEYHLVGEAADGVQALQLVREYQPDIVLMDLVMPKMSGIEAGQAILKEFPATWLVAFSTLDQEATVMRALEVGFSEYIVKPFQGEQILKALRGLGDKEVVADGELR